MKTLGLALVAGFCAAAISAGLQAQPANAQDTSAAAAATAKPQTAGQGMYYVDFRARTAASYGHAFVWYGRSGQRQVEVAGVHPATDSVIPYIIGHVLPVPAETGKSYGDLDEQYLTASYRVYMNEAQAREVFAYIKRLEGASVVWNAATWNCVAFIQAIARIGSTSCGRSTAGASTCPAAAASRWRALRRSRSRRRPRGASP
jgi:hypothetical protein